MIMIQIKFNVHILTYSLLFYRIDKTMFNTHWSSEYYASGEPAMAHCLHDKPYLSIYLSMVQCLLGPSKLQKATRIVCKHCTAGHSVTLPSFLLRLPALSSWSCHSKNHPCPVLTFYNNSVPGIYNVWTVLTSFKGHGLQEYG